MSHKETMIELEDVRAFARLSINARDRSIIMPQNQITDLLMLLRKNHHDKHSLCDRLEEIADSLPDNLDRQICAAAARSIDPILKKAHQFEEEELYPKLAEHNKSRREFDLILSRMTAEHNEDLYFGEEVRDALLALASDTPVQSADATGYMLRGFFENLRRHMAFEAEIAKSIQHTKNGAGISSSAAK